ncbi:hypothetical protein AWM75_05295 [Aerococcus urinaehominis]|uniref:Flavoprotein n=1 Tax=Aerococcus urinaehominis TaxID=128944 RepID=A0A109RGW3_9LACT|nr:NAD(P)/FAD-dependent oxidoreductase [Aerococcus urinaehominis]AMB99444.1 hypothetical protein AWM75_05295 [Aerococcus urinaehominis]SDM28778.1 hypothetical protein SAMN04487985_11120 [Aerococcus urinaehominis]
MIYDVLVIGGGTSGLMAAVSASLNGAQSIKIIEKNPSLGKKLLLTGGTRCNVTNNRPADEVIRHIPGNGKFLYSAFSNFDNYDIMAFFTDRGVALKEEDHGRMFPTTDSAKTILNVFIEEIKQAKIEVQTKVQVKSLVLDQDKQIGVVLDGGQVEMARTLILAVGGKSYPRTGTTGDGYKLAKQAGHHITPLYPTEAPITSEEGFIKDKTLQGLTLRDIDLKVLNPAGKTIINHRMDMIFTHFGISGPAALRCSMFVNQSLSQDSEKEVTMSLDCQPDLSYQDLRQAFVHAREDNYPGSLTKLLKQWMPERYAKFLLDQCQISQDRSAHDLSNQQIEKLCQAIKAYSFKVTGTWPIEKGFVTGGGVNLKEIWPHAMQSKLNPHLFICGELLDINGYTGGYNITAAFVTGYTAGQNAAWMSMS